MLICVYRYPYLACELLCSETREITDALFNQPGALDQLYSFVYKEPPLSHLLSNYCTKIVLFLLDRRAQDTITFLKTKKAFVPNFIKKLPEAGMSDLLMRFLSLEDKPDGAPGTIQVRLCCCLFLSFSVVKRFANY